MGKMIIELLVTCLFCAVLYRFGVCDVINGKTIAYGLILWMIGFYEGRNNEKKRN